MGVRNLLLLLLLIFSFILTGCTVMKESFSNASSNETPKLNQTIIAVLNETMAGQCSSHWGCISSVYKAYQLANCTWTDKKECALGCVDGECRTPRTCTRGYKCNGMKKRGLQIESCEWIIEEDCDWGCENATCKPKPNQTAVVEQPAKTTAPQTTIHTLKAGTEESIDYAGENHVLSIYLLEVDKVRLNLDGKKSEWLMEDDSFASGSLKITVIDILLQPYAGGTQEILYTTGDS